MSDDSILSEETISNKNLFYPWSKSNARSGFGFALWS